jgi:hypothetical protein
MSRARLLSGSQEADMHLLPDRGWIIEKDDLVTIFLALGF